MNKLLFYGIALTCINYSQVVTQDVNLRKGCTALFTEDAQKIIGQFRPRTSAGTLKEYEQFITATKLYDDLGFRIRSFDRLLTSTLRAQLRTPLQRYSDCRTLLATSLGAGYQTLGLQPTELTPCETTYAVLVQQTLNEFKKSVLPSVLQSYKEFMIQLKKYEDLAYKMRQFEKKTDRTIVGQLRMAARNYSTCRDSIIRIEVSPPKLTR